MCMMIFYEKVASSSRYRSPKNIWPKAFRKFLNTSPFHGSNRLNRFYELYEDCENAGFIVCWRASTFTIFMKSFRHIYLRTCKKIEKIEQVSGFKGNLGVSVVVRHFTTVIWLIKDLGKYPLIEFWTIIGCLKRHLCASKWWPQW